MDRRQKRALAICFNKKRKITADDLSQIYVQGNTQKNCLKYFHNKGYLKLDPTYGMSINPDAVPEIYEELVA